MKRTAFRLITLAAVLAVILPASSLTADQGPANPGAITPRGPADHWVYLPVIGRNTSFLPPIISETTNVIDDATNQHLVAVSADGATYTFDQNTPVLQKLAPGEVMVSAPTDLAPHGFLRRVTTVNAAGGQVVVQTQPATLEDAIYQGDIHFDQTLTPAGTAAREVAPGMILYPAAAAGLDSGFYMTIKDVVLDDADGDLQTKDDQIVANGSIEVQPTVHWALPIRQGAIESLRFTVEDRQTTDLRLDIRMAAASVQKELRLGPPILVTTSVIPVGPMPIVIAWVLTFNVGIDGRVHIGVGTQVKNVHTTNAGLQ